MSFPIYLDWDRLSTLLNQNLGSKSIASIVNTLIVTEQRTFSLIKESRIFLSLAKILKSNPRCAVKAAQVLSEIAKNDEMKKPCIEADLVLTLIPFLESTDQDMLLHAGRAIGRICYDNPKEALSKTKIAEQLVKQLRRAENHERLEIIFEVLQALAENDALKVQLVEAGVQEVLSDILLRLQGNSQAEDTCVVKATSDLIVSLLLGGKNKPTNNPHSPDTIKNITKSHWNRNGNCVRMVQVGVIHQLLDLLEKHVESEDISVQHAALSALRNLAIPVVNKVQMLEEGVAERIQALLRSEMPPVQFKLLGTLRMLADGQADAAEILGQDPMLLNRLVQWCDVSDDTDVCGEANRLLASILRHNRSQEVVKAVQEAQGVKHLVSMTMSEHAAMQNEALNALAIASAIDLGIILLKVLICESQLVQSLHKLLQDDNTGAEVKYNSMSLLCSLLNSGNCISSTLVMQGWMFVSKVFAVSGMYCPCDVEISEQ
uniref:Rap1 GTPase-GDP dissociation stimulator 1 n=1 Tax=Phasianus colchicus TaxID=9054 RepID=A0A669QNJ6_PHACC